MKRFPELPALRKSVLLPLAMAFVLNSSSASVRAGISYGYTSIATNLSLTFPAINDNGVVAFEGRFPTVSGVYSGNGGPLTTIGAGVPTAAYNVWINNSNQVAFIDKPSLSVVSVSRGTGGPITTIHTYSPGGPFEQTFTLPVISDDGVVTYLSPNTGIFSGTGGGPKTVLAIPSSDASHYTGTFQNLAVSHNGTLVYPKYSPSGLQYVVNRAGIESPITSLTATSSISVNNQGVVAMVGGFNDGFSFTEYGLYLADGSSITRVAGTGFAVTPSGNASLNDQGKFAFLGDYVSANNAFKGIFTGPDPVLDRIIQTGDLLAGSTVTDLAIGTDALNNNGQVVFWAQMANGTSGVFIGSPVPEPASVGILAIATVSLLIRRRSGTINGRCGNS